MPLASSVKAFSTPADTIGLFGFPKSAIAVIAAYRTGIAVSFNAANAAATALVSGPVVLSIPNFTRAIKAILRTS